MKTKTTTEELYIGADLHEGESQLAIFEPSGSLVMEKRVRTNNLKKFVSSLPGKKHIGIEATGFVYPIYDSLVETGADVTVANPTRIRLIAESRTKHDRVDARVLGELLRTNFFPKSHIPPEEVRENRLLAQNRATYADKRAGLKNSIKWLLKRKGVIVKKPLSSDGRKLLTSLGMPEIDYRLRELELVDSIIKDMDRRIISIVSKHEEAQLLDTIPGVGPKTALFLASALDDINRFPDSKHACAYLGLVPSLHQSGDVSYSGHITKQGNKWLRRNLVECARAAVRYDPHFREFHQRIARRRGAKKATIAVARKIVSYAYWLLKRKITYEELSPLEVRLRK